MDILKQAGRSAAMQGGELVKGAASLIALPTDTIVHLVNLAAGHRVMTPAAETIGNAIDSVTPRPQNETERVTNAVARALGGAATGIGAGQAIGGALGGALASNPGQQLAGAVTGATAQQEAAEHGAGPVGQTVAGVVGAVAPSVGAAGLSAGTRAVVRGGEGGRQQIADNIGAFQAAGTTPTIGQATQGRVAQAAESLLSRTPGSAGVMAGKATDQASDISAGLERAAAKLSPQASTEQAGRAISGGISGDNGFVSLFKRKQGELYDKLDQYIPADTKVDVSNTRTALDALNASIPDAPNLSKFFKNAKIQGIQSALESDANQTQAYTPSQLKSASDQSSTIGQLNDALGEGKLPYEAIKKLRTLVGNEMSDSWAGSDVPRSKWKTLYAALSSDLQGAAKQAGPDATAAWGRANNYTRAGMQRIDTLQHVIDKNGGPEKIFSAAMSGTKDGGTTLRAVMQSLPEDAQKTLSATVIRRLGLAKPGTQNDLGDRFSTETFLTNWNSMSPQAKSALFDRYGPAFRQNMDQVAKVAANLREGSAVFRNPSGTGQAVAQTTAAATFLSTLMTGHYGAAGAVAGGVVGSNLAARLLTNPNAVKWLATATKAPQSAIPALLNRAAQSDDPDLQELSRAVSGR